MIVWTIVWTIVSKIAPEAGGVWGEGVKGLSETVTKDQSIQQ